LWNPDAVEANVNTDRDYTAPRTYLVTGSASGIGYSVKEYLEGLGHRVIGADLQDADIVADLSTLRGRESLVEQATRLSSGRLDAVLAVAGVDSGGALTISVNYYGAKATLEGLRPLLLRAPAPRAVAVSSITSVHEHDEQMVTMMLNGTEEQARARAEVAPFAYASSKRALSRWIRRAAISAEWASAGIPLNAVAPGLVRTALLDRLFDEPATERRIRAGTPMPLTEPFPAERVAELLAFLTSEQNGQITGQTIFIDGGADAIIRGDGVW
jgi:NAD(P)-dependent dehydrogenase (short-subunit alcohol dehydrogenase family)